MLLTTSAHDIRKQKTIPTTENTESTEAKNIVLTTKLALD